MTALALAPSTVSLNSQLFLPVAIVGSFCHIGEEVEIHYRWHALHGRRLRRYYAEKRRGSDVVVVEDEPGVATVIAGWMLDRATCATMELGDPQVSVQSAVGSGSAPQG